MTKSSVGKVKSWARGKMKKNNTKEQESPMHSKGILPNQAPGDTKSAVEVPQAVDTKDMKAARERTITFAEVQEVNKQPGHHCAEKRDGVHTLSARCIKKKKHMGVCPRCKVPAPSRTGCKQCFIKELSYDIKG